MEKNLRIRMLEKTERHRVKRNARRVFLRLHPNYLENAAENTRRSVQSAQDRKRVNETRFSGIFPKTPSIFSKVKSFLSRLGRKA